MPKIFEDMNHSLWKANTQLVIRLRLPILKMECIPCCEIYFRSKVVYMIGNQA